MKKKANTAQVVIDKANTEAELANRKWVEPAGDVPKIKLELISKRTQDAVSRRCKRVPGVTEVGHRIWVEAQLRHDRVEANRQLKAILAKKGATIRASRLPTKEDVADKIQRSICGHGIIPDKHYESFIMLCADAATAILALYGEEKK